VLENAARNALAVEEQSSSLSRHKRNN